MIRNSATEIQDVLQRRDQRIAEQKGVRWLAKHMYTYGLSEVNEPVKMSGNVDHYKEAESKLALKWNWFVVKLFMLIYWYHGYPNNLFWIYDI